MNKSLSYKSRVDVIVYKSSMAITLDLRAIILMAGKYKRDPVWE